MAGIDHVLVLGLATTLRLKLVAGDLVVGPPLVALNMFVDRVHLDGTVPYVMWRVSFGAENANWLPTSWTNEGFALIGNRVPVPLEHLNDDLWRESLRVARMLRYEHAPFPEFCLGDGAAAARVSKDERASSPYMMGSG
jgi:hypothetical protein